MSRVLIIALVVLAAVGGTGPAGASAGHRESRPAIATAPTVAAWSLPASAQTLQIEQAGSDTSLKAPEADCGGGAGPEAARLLDGYCFGFRWSSRRAGVRWFRRGGDMAAHARGRWFG